MGHRAAQGKNRNRSRKPGPKPIPETRTENPDFPVLETRTTGSVRKSGLLSISLGGGADQPQVCRREVADLGVDEIGSALDNLDREEVVSGRGFYLTPQAGDSRYYQRFLRRAGINREEYENVDRFHNPEKS